MVSWILWVVVAVLLVALVALQVRGVRALREWGVAPSRMTLVLRVINTAAVLGLVAFALITWVS